MCHLNRILRKHLPEYFLFFGNRRQLAAKVDKKYCFRTNAIAAKNVECRENGHVAVAVVVAVSDRALPARRADEYEVAFAKVGERAGKISEVSEPCDCFSSGRNSIAECFRVF